MTKVMLCDFLEKIDEAAGSRRAVLPVIHIFVFLVAQLGLKW
jgi:hypothetical protein